MLQTIVGRTQSEFTKNAEYDNLSMNGYTVELGNRRVKYVIQMILPKSL